MMAHATPQAPDNIQGQLRNLDDLNCEMIRIVGALRVAAEFISSEAEQIADEPGYRLRRRVENGCFALDVAIDHLNSTQERLCAAKDALWKTPHWVAM